MSVKPVRIVCHRGANHAAPENTLAAVRQCIEWGADIIEVDVRTSRDGVLYNLHDPTLDRTTNGSGPLRAWLADDLDRLDAGGWFSERFAGEPLARIETLLHYVRGKGGVFFDVKDASLPALIALVRTTGLERDSFFWFGEDANAHEFRRLAPDLRLKVNAATVDGIERANRDFRADIIEVGMDCLNPRIVQACHERGMELMVIHTQNDPDGFRRAFELGADYMNVDHPDIAIAVREAMHSRTA